MLVSAERDAVLAEATTVSLIGAGVGAGRGGLGGSSPRVCSGSQAQLLPAGRHCTC